MTASIQHLDGPEQGGISFDSGNPTIIGTDGAQLSLTDDATISGGNNRLVVLGNISASGDIFVKDLNINYDALPTADPNVKGKVYRNGSNQLFVSAG